MRKREEEEDPHDHQRPSSACEMPQVREGGEGCSDVVARKERGEGRKVGLGRAVRVEGSGREMEREVEAYHMDSEDHHMGSEDYHMGLEDYHIGSEEH